MDWTIGFPGIQVMSIAVGHPTIGWYRHHRTDKTNQHRNPSEATFRQNSTLRYALDGLSRPTDDLLFAPSLRSFICWRLVGNRLSFSPQMLTTKYWRCGYGGRREPATTTPHGTASTRSGGLLLSYTHTHKRSSETTQHPQHKHP